MREGVMLGPGQSWKASWGRAIQTDSKALEGEEGRAFQHSGVMGSWVKALQVGLTHAAQ